MSLRSIQADCPRSRHRFSWEVFLLGGGAAGGTAGVWRARVARSKMDAAQLRMSGTRPVAGVCEGWPSRTRRAARRLPRRRRTLWWPPSSMSPARDSCRARACWQAWRRAWVGGLRWCAPRPGSVRRPCWATGRGAAAGRWRGCRWTPVTTTRRGSGGMSPRRWRGCDRGLARPGGGRQRPRFEAVGPAVSTQLGVLPGEDAVVLVLDDYHLIEAPAVHDSVVFLLEWLPPGLRLVLASRTDPPLPLARLRARGQLAELRVADLRFTPGETAMFLRQATRVGPPAGSVAGVLR